MATAAFPAWPPDVIRNSDAGTFVPASGNLSTRMTMSCTAPPAHRMRAVPFFGRDSIKANLVLYPCADDVMRDCHRRRSREPLRMLAHQHGCDFFLGKPAGVLEFLTVDHDFTCQRLGMTTDHKRSREWPGLRSKIDDAAARDARFFARFPVHRVFDRFPGFDITRETRPHRRHETRAAAEETPVAVGRKHDNDRVGAREMFGLALRAIPPPAAADRLRRSPAIGAEPVACVPMQHGLRFGNRWQMVSCDKALHRDRAEVRNLQIAARFQCLS